MEVIYSVISPFELAKLKDLVITIDPKAFLIINETQEVIGRGFDQPTEVLKISECRFGMQEQESLRSQEAGFMGPRTRRNPQSGIDSILP